MAVKKNILEQYIEIRKEISDLERRIAEGNKKIKLLEKQTVCDVVTGSREDNRYGTIKIEGIAKQEIDRQWELLHARTEKLHSFKEKLEDMIVELEEYIQTIPDSEIRRITRFRCMDGLEWRQVAKCMGKGYTDDSCGQSAFQFSIAVNAMLRQEVHGPGGLFQIVQFRPMREPGIFLSLDIVLDINEQTDLSVTLLRLPGKSGASGDPGGDGILRVVHAQGFHPGKPLLIRSPAGHIFSPLYLIPLLLQAAEQIFKICGGRYEPVDGFFQLGLVASPGLGRRMLNIALALVLSGDDDG